MIGVVRARIVLRIWPESWPGAEGSKTRLSSVRVKLRDETLSEVEIEICNPK